MMEEIKFTHLQYVIQVTLEENFQSIELRNNYNNSTEYVMF